MYSASDLVGGAVSMRSKVRFLIIVLVLLLVTACTNDAIKEESPFPEVQEPYTAEKATLNGDVVNIFEKIANLEKWEQFIKNVNGKIKDQVRITQYTIEGDPIFYELVYDGNTIQYTYDNSLDINGADSGRPSTLCKRIGTKQNESGHEYYSLLECDNDTSNTFWFIKK